MRINLRTVKNLILSGVVLIALSGCGEKTEQSGVIATEKQVARLSMLDEAVTDYEVPVSKPSILTDTYGYEPGETKKAILVSENLPKKFSLRRADNGASVYEGSVKFKFEDPDTGLATGIADFSDYTEEGRYYLETELLGRSLDFSIKTGVYDNLYNEAEKKLQNLKCDTCHLSEIVYENDTSKTRNVSGGWHTDENGGKDVVEGCLAVMDICTAVEYYASSLPDSDENRIPDILELAMYEVEWLKKMQNSETGGVYTSVSYRVDEGATTGKLYVVGETTRATAYYCACMAKYSYTINKYNSIESTKALQAADIAWKCLQVNKDIVDADQMFRASTEMYRATGKYDYKSYVESYLKENADKDYSGRLVLDGAITYLDTQRSTRVEYCTPLMSNFMTRTETFAADSEKSQYLVAVPENPADLLRSVYELAIVEYIISNTSYTGLEEECLHYMLGRNALSEDYINELKTPDDYVKLCIISAKLSSCMGE